MISAQEPPSTFWVNWLTAVAAGFSLPAYADSVRISSFGDEAAAYIALAHAVLNAVFPALFAIPLLATGKSFCGKQA